MLLEPSFLHVTELQGDETNYSPFSSIEDTGQFFLEKRRARVQRTRGLLVWDSSQLQYCSSQRKGPTSRSTSTNTGRMDLGIAFDKHRGSWAVFLPSLSASFNGCILRGGKIVAFKKSKVRHNFLPIKSYHNDRRALTLRYFSIRLRRHAATTSQRND